MLTPLFAIANYLVSVVELFQLFPIHSSPWFPFENKLITNREPFCCKTLPVISFRISKIVVQGNVKLPVMLCQAIQSSFLSSLKIRVKILPSGPEEKLDWI